MGIYSECQDTVFTYDRRTGNDAGVCHQRLLSLDTGGDFLEVTGRPRPGVSRTFEGSTQRDTEKGACCLSAMRECLLRSCGTQAQVPALSALGCVTGRSLDSVGEGLLCAYSWISMFRTL